MKEKLFARLEVLYDKMQEAYSDCAKQAGLSCTDCADNCCTSYFKHHTYIEWLYLWKGLRLLSAQKRMAFIELSKKNTLQAERVIAIGAVPVIMCPLNENGLCALYKYRLMICRMHGTRNTLMLPSGETRVFQGCKKFTELYPNSASASAQDIPTIDRTDFYKELASIEMDLLRSLKKPMPKVNLTLAEMLANGTPKF